MSILDAGYGRSALPLHSKMFGLHSVLGVSNRTEPQQDSSSSTDTSVAETSKASGLTSRSSSGLFRLSRSSKRLSPEPAFELSCEVAIRPGFCWNSHGDTWQPGGVWSQFETGLKSCQDDAYMCTNFLGHPDAVFAGVFDGHGFNGRSAATYARKHAIRWLSVDSNAASKDPKRRMKALESICSQIDRGLARPELCSFDASSSGLTACFGSLQGSRICLATSGNCKAVLANADSNSPRLSALDLTHTDTAQPRATSETSAQRQSPGVRPMKSLPLQSPFAGATLPSPPAPQGFLGRGTLGERPRAPPLMTTHKLTSQAQFIVLATSGVWDVMTPQEAVDFVQQCRGCRPDNVSCSAALTLEAHTRWKLKFSKVIAEDVAAVIIHCGQAPQPAPPAHRLPAFPEAATTNHDANDEHILHETREFWGRLHPQSLVPLLQTALSKGKSPMPSSLIPDQNPQLSHSSWSTPKAASPNGTSHEIGHGTSREMSHSNSHVGTFGFWGRRRSPRDRETKSNPRDSLDSSRMGSQQDSSMHSSRGTMGESRTVHFDLPSSESSDSDKENDSVRRDTQAQALQGREQAGAMIRKTSPPMDISFRPDTPEMGVDYPCHIVSSSGHSSTSTLATQSPERSAPVDKASTPPPSPQTTPKPPPKPQQPAPNPFLAASMADAEFSDLSDEELDLSLHGAASGKIIAKALHKSPSRAHAQQPLSEGEAASSIFKNQTSIAKLSMMERTHSAPGGIPFGMLMEFPGTSRPRRRIPEAIPEDHAVLPASPSADDATSINRPIRKIYPHGSGDLDEALHAEAQASPQTDPPEPPRTTPPQATGYVAKSEPEGRVHGIGFPTVGQLQSEAKLGRVQFPKGRAPATSAPHHFDSEMDGRCHSHGLGRVASHPENLAELAQAADNCIPSPFARRRKTMPSPEDATSSSLPASSLHAQGSWLNIAASSSNAAGSINPWASPTRSGSSSLLSQRSSNSTFSKRSRNSSAALDELLRIRGGSKAQRAPGVPVSTSM